MNHLMSHHPVAVEFVLPRIDTENDPRMRTAKSPCRPRHHAMAAWRSKNRDSILADREAAVIGRNRARRTLDPGEDRLARERVIRRREDDLNFPTPNFKLRSFRRMFR